MMYICVTFLTNEHLISIPNTIPTQSNFIQSVTMTARDGRLSRLENVYLRGGNIKFIVLPELLKSAPIFKKVQVMRNKKVGDMDLNGGRGGRGDGGRGRGRGREAGRGGGRGRN